MNKLSRYQTYVFDSKFDEDKKVNAKWRDVLGPDYKGGVPVAWQDGDGLQDKNELLDFIEKIISRDFDSIEEVEDAAEKVLENIQHR